MRIRGLEVLVFRRMLRTYLMDDLIPLEQRPFGLLGGYLTQTYAVFISRLGSISGTNHSKYFV